MPRAGVASATKAITAVINGASTPLSQTSAGGVDATNQTAQTRLRGPNGSRVTLKFEDGEGRIVSKKIARNPEVGQPVTVGPLATMFLRVKNGQVITPAGAKAGVIGFNVWVPALDEPFQKAVDEFLELGREQVRQGCGARLAATSGNHARACHVQS